MIRTCLFDMGNVLVHFSHDRMCTQLGALCSKSGSEIRRLVFDTGLLIEFECGRLSEAGFRRRFEGAVGQPMDPEALRIAWSDIFTLNESMPSILDRLIARGVRLVLLSNTSVSHLEWVRDRFDLISRFDDCVLSYEVGAMKPDSAIFEAAIKKIDCAPAECFFTDDIEANVEAGRQFGLQAETFTDAVTLISQLHSRGLVL